MQIYTELTNLKHKYKNIVVALGTFDGIHIGHQKIINKAVDLAKSIKGISVVVTFSNHPLEVINLNLCPPQINSNFEKEKILKNIGLDILFNIPFTKSLLSLPPEDFLSLLCEHLDPKYLVAGPNYSFGYKGKGTPQLLKKLGAKFGFNAYIHPEVYYDNIMVSSTRIRNLLIEGNITLANKLLGRPFSFYGTVCQGDQRGRLLGFPTANILDSTEKILPAAGVYVTKTTVNNTTYFSITNIGVNPTFNGNSKHLETHLFDFNGNLYKKTINIEFFKRIRNEKRFANIDCLKKQINDDILFAKNFWV
ncbi:bifunctional riboflavin kinase/FAD synthetase [Anaerosinus gibii]|uniref:Riboflavin biosynthesis protein n=1 Tax=Selenobaculum gibii TaxID=3054208 RepID=A0A9Y2AL53_9FIRM|nr:bifunctional riboflavin kinase/FAD synthetase [Selenobaculum gbiensis]WIW71893.1 bifunctional riboflavin kinase/FAD synthetase [Selenobaculum gbiensis]